MQSLIRGWSFLKQAWQMALRDRDLLKPSIFALIVNSIVTILGLIPLIGAALLLDGSTGIGQAVMGVIGATLLFAQYVVGYVFSGMTVYLIYGFLAEGDGRLDAAWNKVRREFWDIVSLAAASTAVKLVANSLRKRTRRGGGAAAVGGLAAGILETVWTEAAYLILPAIMIEDANLPGGIKRATQIVKDNLLLIGVSTVGVRWITGLIGFISAVVGLIIGGGLGYGIISALGSSTAGLILGIGIGALVFFGLVVVSSLVNSYTTTAYHTCLFLWARDVEKARAQGQTIAVAAPAPLRAALSGD
ncbi:MAG: hypothetical protein V1755_01680 [Chloroflexota bacterium]